MASSASRGVPRVYDDFQDGDTRLDPGALMGGSPGRGAGVRGSSGTVLMPAAVSRAPAVSRTPAAIAIVPRPAVSVVSGSPPAEPAKRRKDSSTLFWEFTAIEIAVGAVGIVTFGVVVAILAVQFI